MSSVEWMLGCQLCKLCTTVHAMPCNCQRSKTLPLHGTQWGFSRGKRQPSLCEHEKKSGPAKNILNETLPMLLASVKQQGSVLSTRVPLCNSLL